MCLDYNGRLSNRSLSSQGGKSGKTTVLLSAFILTRNTIDLTDDTVDLKNAVGG